MTFISRSNDFALYLQPYQIGRHHTLDICASYFFYSYKLIYSQSTTRVLHILLHISINLAFKVIFTKKKKKKSIYINIYIQIIQKEKTNI